MTQFIEYVGKKSKKVYQCKNGVDVIVFEKNSVFGGKKVAEVDKEHVKELLRHPSVFKVAEKIKIGK